MCAGYIALIYILINMRLCYITESRAELLSFNSYILFNSYIPIFFKNKHERFLLVSNNFFNFYFFIELTLQCSTILIFFA